MNPTTPVSPQFPDMTNVQGNSLGGFLKDHQRFMFFRVARPVEARRWIAKAADELVASAAEVRIFNDAFKKIRRVGDPDRIASTWVNVAFTHEGLRALDLSDADLAGFEDAFSQDIIARAGTPAVGDVGASAPGNWDERYQDPDTMHMLVIVASDSPGSLDDQCARVRNGTAGAFELLFEELGAVRGDRRGHEHFGFKDGISQPRPQVAATDDVASDGTLPWDFVCNGVSPAQPPSPSQPPAGSAQSFGYPATTPTSPPVQVSNLPSRWMHEGSYVVFRKLAQDVPGFEQFVNAPPAGLTPDQFGAKLVGRYKSGFPLANIPGTNPAAGDPEKATPPVDYDESTANAFDYSADPGGALMPKGAHIQKSNPRFNPGSRPRLMRRGIPYGDSYDDGADRSGPNGSQTERGLLFVSYQASIEAQFEFINRVWLNDATFQGGSAGQDPIIGQSAGQCTFAIPGASTPSVAVPRFVTTKGMVYLFAPSIAGLHHIGSR